MESKDTYVTLYGCKLAELAPLAPDQYLELPRGLTVLYGRNGVGKSRVLEAVRSGTVAIRWPAMPFDPAVDGEREEPYLDSFDPDRGWSQPWSNGMVFPEHDLGLLSGPGITHGVDVAALMLEPNWGFLTLEQLTETRRRFLSLNDSPFDATVQRRLWEILLDTVIGGTVGREFDSLVADALVQLAAQGRFAVRLGIADRRDHTRVSHLVCIEEAPALARLYELSRNETDWDALRASGLGLLFSHVLVDENQMVVDPSPAPLWFGLPVHPYLVAGSFRPVNLITDMPVDLASVTELEVMRMVTAAEVGRPGAVQIPPDLRAEGDAAREPMFTGTVAFSSSEYNRVWARAVLRGKDGHPTGFALELAKSLSRTANRLCRLLLEDAPPLELEVSMDAVGGRSAGFTWFALDLSGGRVSIEQLSSAQQRWAGFAIQVAAAQLDHRLPTLVVLDEPEAGLHRRAERHLVNGLSELGEEMNAHVVVATHSPAFLRADLARLVQVSRDVQGRAVLEPMGSKMRDRMRQLGLDPADFLQLCRKIVLVEGEHEVVILKTLFGDYFEERGIVVFALRGGAQLKHAVDAKFLFDYSDAPIVVLLDNGNTQQAMDLWDEARDRSARGLGFAATLEQLEKVSPGGEGKFLRDFCQAALAAGRGDRVQRILMLNEPDILDHLPYDEFVPTENRKSGTPTSWAKARALHKRPGQQGKGNFKTWMAREFSADFTIKNLERVLSEVDPPNDLMALGPRIHGDD